ncbi:MAG: hypothetical protein Q7W02_02430 [Candidatus Rokubacteria bacterium]|nr:hypothetical protein [Candidatus Rokubacteria bacterium]
MTTMVMILMMLLVLFVAWSATRLWRLHRAAAAQFDLNLRLGGEVARSLTTLSELIDRATGESREVAGRLRAEADRVILEARGESAAPERPS